MTLKLISELLKRLEDEGISYCHWKSNTAMEKTLTGENDLDILVAKPDEDRFVSVLSRLNFIRVIAPNESWFPGITNYYAYDADGDRVVHVHLHDRLVLGYDLIKNYHLPLEKDFLERAEKSQGLNIPPTELELITLVIRLVLKRRLLARLTDLFFILGKPKKLLRDIFNTGRGDIPPSAQAELEDLQARSSIVKIEHCLKSVFPFLPRDLYLICLASLSADAPRFAWLTAGRRLAKVLKPYRRHSLAATCLLTASRAFGLRLGGLARRLGWRAHRRNRIAHGGKIIAFMGGDGSGKTTNIERFNSWFGNWFEVGTLHIGKPQKGILWYGAGAFLKLRKLVCRIPSDDFHNAVIHLMIARYRYKTFRKAVRLRSRGVLVGLDRFPLPGMELMESPQIRRLFGTVGIFSYLSRIEEAYHEKIRGADKIIVLMLDPKNAHQRRPEDNQAVLSLRLSEIWDRKWPNGFARLIDAEMPLNEVVKNVRITIWECLPKRNKVIEIIGPAGAGKSSVARNIMEKSQNIQNGISWRDDKVIFLKVIFRRFPKICNLIWNRFPTKYIKILIGCESVVDILLKNKKNNTMACGNFLLEAGPIYLLSTIKIDFIQSANGWIEELESKAFEVVDNLVWLDASNEVLETRVNERSKFHFMKNESTENFDKFMESYRKSFSETIKNSNNRIHVNHINTENETIERVTFLVNSIF